MPLVDRFARPLGNLRLSVTDRCNLRCAYCMPEDDYAWLPREDLLQFEETIALVDVFLGLGVTKVRLTGGEPLMRRDLPDLVRMLAAKPGLADLALTTNGVLLADQIDALAAAGLGRVTVSLDTLRADRFEKLTRFDRLDAVLEGIKAAGGVSRAAATPERESLRSSARSSARGGGAPRALKIDSVVIRGVNDDELVDLIEYGKSTNAEVRFIEYMDVGGATRWSQADVVSRVEMLDTLTRRYGRPEPLAETSSAPAERFSLPDGTIFGIISSTTDPFCRSCDRSRLTADGMWYLCLYAALGVDLRGPLRRGESADVLAAMIAENWRGRTDRGAEDRLALRDRRVVPIRDLRKDPHLEMHTRGG
ncbi:MAG: GTP 3',8-cyclase MoaA [Vicinamibacterales bacterium]